MISRSIFLITLIAGFATLTMAQSNNVIEYRILAVSKTDDGLTASSNHARTILPMNIQLPTAFSPNGDGLNDTFGMVAEGVEDFQLTIFNRWGEIVFQTDQKEIRWDGTFKGKMAPVGVYGYELAAKNADRESTFKKGSVTLVN